jgi:hypothetical protein
MYYIDIFKNKINLIVKLEGTYKSTIPEQYKMKNPVLIYCGKELEDDCTNTYLKNESYTNIILEKIVSAKETIEKIFEIGF